MIISHQGINISSKFIRHKRLYNYTVNWLRRKCKSFSWSGFQETLPLPFEQFLGRLIMGVS